MFTEKNIREIAPRDKVFMVSDCNGLYLEVHPAGYKYWKLRYWVDKKERRASLGIYPQTSLDEARKRRDEAKKQIAATGDIVKEEPSDTFKDIALEWFKKKMLGIRSDSYADTVIGRIRRLLFPALGHMEMSDINARDVLDVLFAIERRGNFDLPHRVLNIAGQIFRYAVASGRVQADITRDLRGALRPAVGKHHAAIIEPAEIGKLMREIHAVESSIIVKCALVVVAHTFVRSGELRHAEWNEIDIDAGEWRIPAEKMKMRRVHIVPLSRQVVEALADLKIFTGAGKYVFPSNRSVNGTTPMSENTILAALRRMGYTKEQMTGHGFRSMASTRLNESGLWSTDIIELQLAHTERDGVRAAYNYAQHLDKRREMLQWWSDYLDRLCSRSLVT